VVEASAYTLEKQLELMESAKNLLIDNKMQDYEKALESITDEFDNIMIKYPHDDELADFAKDFSRFCDRRTILKFKRELKELKELVTYMRHMVHWRKLGMAAGKDLPWKDFRTMRGSAGERHI